MNDIEVQRLAHAINELRPGWPISSLTTFIRRNLASRVYRDAAVALVWVALDADGAGNPITDTPKRVLEPGPWWRAAEHSGSVVHHIRRPPKRGEECKHHVGEWADNCRGCRADVLAAPAYGHDAPAPKPTRGPAGDAKTGADLCRAAMRGEEEA